MQQRPKKKVAYVVLRGRIPGIYVTWDDCRAQVDGFEKNCFKGYTDYESAIRVWDHWEQHGVNLIEKERAKAKALRRKKRNSPRIPKPTSKYNSYARDLVRRFSLTNGTGTHYRKLQ